jgi:hypothetical protein
MRIVDTYAQRDLYTGATHVGCVYNDDFGSHLVEVPVKDGTLPLDKLQNAPVAVIERLAALVEALP